jgi:hypothetical protein
MVLTEIPGMHLTRHIGLYPVDSRGQHDLHNWHVGLQDWHMDFAQWLGHHVDFEQWLGQVNPRRVNQYPPVHHEGWETVFCWVPVLQLIIHGG